MIQLDSDFIGRNARVYWHRIVSQYLKISNIVSHLMTINITPFQFNWTYEEKSYIIYLIFLEIFSGLECEPQVNEPQNIMHYLQILYVRYFSKLTFMSLNFTFELFCIISFFTEYLLYYFISRRFSFLLIYEYTINYKIFYFSILSSFLYKI